MIMLLFRWQEALKATFASLATLLRVVLMSQWRVVRPPRVGERCVILGNGPSLSQSLHQYAPVLANYRRLCVNDFPRSDAFEQIKPDIYLLAAKEYWRDDVLDSYKANSRATFDALLRKTTWQMAILLPYEARGHRAFIAQFAQNPNLKIYYFNMTPVEGFQSWCHYSFDRAWGTPRPHNVLIPCLMLAIGMGFREIYLLGADHSWLPEISVNERNEALVCQKHFYDENAAQANVMYRAGQRPRRLYEILEKFYLTFRAYFDIKDYADRKGVAIYNATPQSFIDAFDRQTLP